MAVALTVILLIMKVHKSGSDSSVKKTGCDITHYVSEGFAKTLEDYIDYLSSQGVISSPVIGVLVAEDTTHCTVFLHALNHYHTDYIIGYFYMGERLVVLNGNKDQPDNCFNKIIKVSNLLHVIPQGFHDQTTVDIISDYSYYRSYDIFDDGSIVPS